MTINKTDIERRSEDSEAGLKNRILLNTLREGEDAMRRKSNIVSVNYNEEGSINKPYLVREKGETQEEFLYRVDYQTSLYTGTSKSIDDINNRIFSKQIMFDIEEEKIKKIVEENFDGAGSSMNEWAKKWNLDALWSGGAFALVNVDGNGKQLFVNEVNPHVISIEIDDVLDMRKDKKGNITLFKYKSDTVEEVDDFNTQKVRYVYLYKNNNSVITLRTFKSIEEKDYIEISNKELPKFMNIIPVVSLYPETKFKNLNPNRPYQNMAYKNKTHWFYMSLYLNLINVASRPFVFAKGIQNKRTPEGSEEPAKITYGIKNMYTNPNKDADMKWVQADSKSSGMIESFLNRIEDEMKMLGSEFLETKSRMTATEAVISTSDTNSKASNFAANLEDSLQNIVYIMLKWIQNEDEEFSLIVNKNVGITKDKEAFDIINILNDKNVVSDKDLRLHTKSLGYLSDEITEEEYLENLEDEGKLMNINFTSNVEELNIEEEVVDEEEGN